MTQPQRPPAHPRAAAPRFSAMHLIACMVFSVFAGATAVAEDALEPRSPVFEVEPTTWEFGVYTGGHINDRNIFNELGLAGVYNTRLFRMSFDFAALNDDKYVSAEPTTMLGYYFDFREGKVQLNLTPVTLTGGRVQHRDEVATPYSLFISSWAPAAVILELAYEDRFFFYRSRWIELTRNSRNFQQRVPVYEWTDPDANPEQDPPFWPPSDPDDPFNQYPDPLRYWWQPLDRGANYKVYGVRLGDWRVGFQESVVYINQSFHPEYFLNPIPMYFIQLFNTEGDFPWVQRDDENSHMGFFVDVAKPDWTAYFQFILGDINLNALTTESRRHPQKWGWSLGGTRDTPVGRFGFYHAGATKYLFAATTVAADNYSTKRYEYAYWPAVEFPYKGATNAIDYRDNYIGYHYGENNLAFMFTHEAQVNRWWVDSMAEFVVSGSKSPANPWHELRGHPGRFGQSNAPHYIHLLNESPLEWTFRLGTTISRSFGPWDLTAKGMLGAVFNELELRAVDDSLPDDEQPEPRLYKPGDQNRLLFDFFLGVRYNFGISPRPEN